MANLDWEVVGLRRLNRKLEEASDRAADLRPVWVGLDRRFTERHQEQFETEGSLTGGWPPLDPEYRRQKEAARGQRTTIMQKFGNLLKSMVNPFDPNAVHRARKQSYERGTALLYASAHQEGARNLPTREVLVFDDDDVAWLTSALGDHLMGPFQIV